MAKREDINAILAKWSKGEITTEEANKQLKEIDAGISLNPNKKGNALIDSGVGSMDVANVVDGKLEGGSAPQCDIYYNGKVWHNIGDDPTLLPGGFPRVEAPAAKRELDMSRKPEFAGTTQKQSIPGGTFEVEYDEDGYAKKATKIK